MDQSRTNIPVAVVESLHVWMLVFRRELTSKTARLGGCKSRRLCDNDMFVSQDRSSHVVDLNPESNPDRFVHVRICPEMILVGFESLSGRFSCVESPSRLSRLRSCPDSRLAFFRLTCVQRCA